MVTRVRRFSPGPHLCPARSAYSTRTTATPEAVGADGPVDAQTRPPVLAKPRGRGFAQAPTAIVFFVIQEIGTEEPDERNPDFYVSTWSATITRHLSFRCVHAAST